MFFGRSFFLNGFNLLVFFFVLDCFCLGDLFTDSTVVNHHHLPPFRRFFGFFSNHRTCKSLSCCEVIFAFELYEGERRSQKFWKRSSEDTEDNSNILLEYVFLGGTWCIMFLGSDRIVL